MENILRWLYWGLYATLHISCCLAPKILAYDSESSATPSWNNCHWPRMANIHILVRKWESLHVWADWSCPCEYKNLLWDFQTSRPDFQDNLVCRGGLLAMDRRGIPKLPHSNLNYHRDGWSNLCGIGQADLSFRECLDTFFSIFFYTYTTQKFGSCCQPFRVCWAYSSFFVLYHYTTHNCCCSSCCFMTLLNILYDNQSSFIPLEIIIFISRPDYPMYFQWFLGTLFEAISPC